VATDLRITVGAYETDIKWLVPTLKGSYWGAHYTNEAILTAIYRSLCFNAWIGSEQVGFARVMTDAALTSVLNDVIVDGLWRGRGFGTALLKAVFAHHQVAPTICILQARPQNFGLYSKFGFVPVGSMLKRDPQ